MTHNPKELRAEHHQTLKYIFRGDKHEHELTPGDVTLIGGNMFNLPSLNADGSFDLEKCATEFSCSEKIHTGKGEKFYRHFVISLAPDEKLSTSQWNDICFEYMYILGYSDCNWVACKHSDTSTEHVHILASRVTHTPSGALVNVHNDYEKGWSVMRKFESQLNLRRLENPNDGFGHNYTKAQIKASGGRIEAQQRDSAHIIRQKIKRLYKTHGKPKTITEFVGLIAQSNISIKVNQKSSGEVSGISYSYEGGPFLSGTRIKKTQLTFNALIKGGISYDPSRDNFVLGINKEAPMYAHFQVQVSSKEAKRIIRQRAQFRLSTNKNNSWVDLSFINTKREKELALAIANIIALLKMMFGVDDESVEFRHLQEQKLLSDLLINKVFYNPGNTLEYDTETSLKDLQKQIDSDTKDWRDLKQDRSSVALTSTYHSDLKFSNQATIEI
ncbi:relaxase/mobilization nuclease domain-containing protein [Vibrio cyclitrophicus]|uniref:relaxase/mobilization nuclease domain-containing protein n=1 Tax=Vibrio cyclitrophicus TaxID=47951 RepID=UPI000C836E1E|nr:relaxase/mobilization nuclease domain-containing protein [Vibrio cyclitrophicus]PMH75157.1 hypothetical protein BCU59_18170 [Vibrio cyclitrophicus]